MPRREVAQVRPCRDNDFEAVVRLLHQLWPATTLDLYRLKVTFRRGLHCPSTRYIVAMNGGDVVGFCSLSVRESLWQQCPLGHVDELVVDERHRGRSIGTQLLEHAGEIAHEMGCSRIELDSAFHRTEAHRLYVKLGFENRAYMFSKVL